MSNKPKSSRTELTVRIGAFSFHAKGTADSVQALFTEALARAADVAGPIYIPGDPPPEQPVGETTT